MSQIALFVLQVTLFSSVPILLAALKNPIRLIYSYIYIGLVLIMGGFLGAVYTFPLTDTIAISGGSIAYGALMMSTLVLLIMERDVDVVRNVIRLVVVVNIFKFFLFNVIAAALDSAGVINLYATSSSVFGISAKFMVIGGLLIILELLLLVLIFERFKTRIQSNNLKSFLYLIFFIVVVCLDGILFPLLAFPFDPALVDIMVGGVKSKFVLASAYSVPLLFFLLTFRRNMQEYRAVPIRLQELIVSPKGELIEEIVRRQTAIDESEERYRDLVENSQDLICTHDLQGRLLFVNKASAVSLGVEPQELVGRNIRNLLEPEYQEQFDEYLKLIQRDGKAESLLTVRTRAGEKRIWEYRNTLRVQGVAEPLVRGLGRDITDRFKAEQQIRYQAKLLDEVNEAIISTDMEFKIVSWNKAAERIYGYLVQNVIGTPLEQQVKTVYLAPDTAEGVLESFLARGYWKGEVLQTAKSGKQINILSSVELIKNSCGEPIGTVAVNRNITERKQAEQALRESQERYRRLADSFPNGTVTVYNRDLRLTFVAGGDMEKFNAKPEDFIGKTFQELSPPETFEIAEPHLRAAFEGRTGSYETPDWFDQYYFVNVAPLQDADGSIREIMVVSQNYTEQKKAEEALRENNEFITNLMENSPVSIYVNTADGKLSLVNRRWETDTGLSRENAIGRPLGEVFPVEIARKFKTDNQSVIETGTSQAFEEFIKPLHLYTVKFPLRNEHGQITAVGGMSMDISSRIKAQQELEHTHQKLRAHIDYLQSAIEDERTAIAREIHDEFGQMLTAMKMDLSWLGRNTVITEQQSQHIQSIHSLVDDAIAVIHRISSELRPGLLDDLGLFPALEWLSGEYSRRADLKCSIQLPPQEPDFDPALRTALFRIFQECMTNVIRHAYATKVESTVRLEGGALIMEVADNGRGITDGELINPKSLGLMGMRERASKWNGSIQIHSAPGKGTKMLVRIPLPNVANGENR